MGGERKGGGGGMAAAGRRKTEAKPSAPAEAGAEAVTSRDGGGPGEGGLLTPRKPRRPVRASLTAAPAQGPGPIFANSLAYVTKGTFG